MSSPFVAEIRIWAVNFAPTGWAFCNGQLIPISQNTALFSLLGTTYGGDGKSTFALPNFQGNGPMQQGQGAGLSDRVLGETSGASTVTVLNTQMPSHNHGLQHAVGGGRGGVNTPAGNLYGTGGQNQDLYAPISGHSTVAMNALGVGAAGSGLPHNNMQPYLTLNFCIALQGIFPARS